MITITIIISSSTESSGGGNRTVGGWPGKRGGARHVTSTYGGVRWRYDVVETSRRVVQPHVVVVRTKHWRLLQPINTTFFDYRLQRLNYSKVCDATLHFLPFLSLPFLPSPPPLRSRSLKYS